jgi:hypothetical protein
MVNIGELTKMPQTVTVSYFPPYNNLNHKNQKKLPNPYVIFGMFKKVGLGLEPELHHIFSPKAGAGAASNIFPESWSRTQMMRFRNIALGITINQIKSFLFLQ